MVIIRLVLLIFSVILLSFSTASLVEFFESCRRPIFHPELWNHNKVQFYNNCYVYALNRPKTDRTKKTSPGLGIKGAGDPGTVDMGRDYNNYTCDYFHQLIINDVPGAFKENANSSTEMKCPDTHHEMALVLDDNKTSHVSDDNDFHFYRRDCGTELWSHKPGSAPVTRLDASGQYITDPKTANHDYPNHDYYKFCGYYCVPNGTNTYDSTKTELKM
jgi:hypothetical protein